MTNDERTRVAIRISCRSRGARRRARRRLLGQQRRRGQGRDVLLGHRQPRRHRDDPLHGRHLVHRSHERHQRDERHERHERHERRRRTSCTLTGTPTAARARSPAAGRRADHRRRRGRRLRDDDGRREGPGAMTAVITGVAFPADGRPVVSLKVTERHGLGVKNLSRDRGDLAVRAAQAGPRHPRHHRRASTAAPTTPGSATSPPTITRRPPAETAAAANLTDHGDGTYDYRLRQGDQRRARPPPARPTRPTRPTASSSCSTRRGTRSRPSTWSRSWSPRPAPTSPDSTTRSTATPASSATPRSAPSPAAPASSAWASSTAASATTCAPASPATTISGASPAPARTLDRAHHRGRRDLDRQRRGAQPRGGPQPPGVHPQDPHGRRS